MGKHTNQSLQHFKVSMVVFLKLRQFGLSAQPKQFIRNKDSRWTRQPIIQKRLLTLCGSVVKLLSYHFAGTTKSNMLCLIFAWCFKWANNSMDTAQTSTCKWSEKIITSRFKQQGLCRTWLHLLLPVFVT